MKTTLKMTALAASLMLCGAASSAATIVQNGSFEAGKLVLNTTGWGVFDGLENWTLIDGPGIEVQTNPTLGFIDAQDGARYVELDSDKNSAMQQILDLVQGTYRLSFWYASRTGEPGSDGIGYSIANLIGTVSSPVTPIDGWSLITGLFTTDGDDVALTFSALGTSNSLGGLIDNVSITPAPVPLPAAGFLLMAALGGLGLMRRRKA